MLARGPTAGQGDAGACGRPGPAPASGLGQGERWKQEKQENCAFREWHADGAYASLALAFPKAAGAGPQAILANARTGELVRWREEVLSHLALHLLLPAAAA